MKQRFSRSAGRYGQRAQARLVNRASLSTRSSFDAGATYPRRTLADDVKSRCWCDSHFVYVTLDDVRAGRTVSCDRPDCHPPQGDTP